MPNKTSGRTVSRYLKSVKWTRKKATKQPDLEEIHKELRFDWAQNHEHYDWSSVVFTDEATFELNQPRYGWSPQGCKIQQKSLTYNPKLQVWAAMWKGGLLYYAIYQGSMDRFLYLSILYHEFFPKIRQELRMKWVFQQDNAKPHTANIVNN